MAFLPRSSRSRRSVDWLVALSLFAFTQQQFDKRISKASQLPYSTLMLTGTLLRLRAKEAGGQLHSQARDVESSCSLARYSRSIRIRANLMSLIDELLQLLLVLEARLDRQVDGDCESLGSLWGADVDLKGCAMSREDSQRIEA